MFALNYIFRVVASEHRTDVLFINNISKHSAPSLYIKFILISLVKKTYNACLVIKGKILHTARLKTYSYVGFALTRIVIENNYGRWHYRYKNIVGRFLTL